MTATEILSTYLSGGVTKNLTLHVENRFSTLVSESSDAQLSKYVKHYGVKNGRFGRERAFSLNKCRKTAILGARFSDHLTSERSSIHNFKD